MTKIIKPTLYAALLLAIGTSFAMEKKVPATVGQLPPSPEELQAAIRQEDVEKVKNLLARGVKLDGFFNKYYSPLAWAVATHRTGVIDLLVEAGAPLAFSLLFSNKGHEIQRAEKEMMDMLEPKVMSILMMQGLLTDETKQRLKNYLNVYYKLFYIKDANKNNLLHQAIYNGNFDAALILIEAMASSKVMPNLLKETNGAGQTPLELGYGRWGGEDEGWNSFIARLPQQYGADAAEAKKIWEKFMAEAFAAGKAGMGLSGSSKAAPEKSTPK
jgi:hypothetical protein